LHAFGWCGGGKQWRTMYDMKAGRAKRTALICARQEEWKTVSR